MLYPFNFLGIALRQYGYHDKDSKHNEIADGSGTPESTIAIPK
jgi:hypothetical protein